MNENPRRLRRSLQSGRRPAASAPAALATLVTLAALAVVPAPAATAAAPPIPEMLTLAAALDGFCAVSLAPDGRRIAWVEAARGKDGRPSEQTEVFTAELQELPPAAKTAAGAMPAARRLGAGGGPFVGKQLAWSPDGRRLAFLSEAAALAGAGRGQAQLWIADLASGKSAQITHLSGQLSAPAWSPDGGALAFLYIAGRTAAAGPTRAVPRDQGVVGETPEEQRLATVELATGTVREISPPELFVYEYDWSPDGGGFAAIAANGSGDDNWWIARLLRIDRASGAARVLLQPSFQIADPRWSPDGSRIAFIGGLMSDQGVTGGDVYAVPAAGGEALDLTPGLTASAAWLGWTASGELLALETVDGGAGLARIDLAGGAATQLWRRAAAFSAEGNDPGLAMTRDGRIAAAVVSSFERPPEIWFGPLAAAAPADPGGTAPADPGATAPADPGATNTAAGWRQLTRRNAGMRPGWGEARSLHWPGDGAPAAGGSGSPAVQGWLLAPWPAGDGAAAGRSPLVVIVHGGPASAARAGWPRVAGVLASQGFYVLMPNPRGSYGQGEDFTRGNVKDFGYGDLRDILGGIDAAAAVAPIDTARTGIFGWSYGGYMTMWAVTQTQRFRAAVAGAGIVNWQSYYGQNRIDQWMIPYFGATVYEDPWIYARSSPISFIKSVRTPTLVLQGERDAEVPAPQAYEFWHALKTLGVETRLVIYPDEGHHLNPADGLDVMQRTVAWLRDHLR